MAMKPTSSPTPPSNSAFYFGMYPSAQCGNLFEGYAVTANTCIPNKADNSIYVYFTLKSIKYVKGASIYNIVETAYHDSACKTKPFATGAPLIFWSVCSPLTNSTGYNKVSLFILS